VYGRDHRSITERALELLEERGYQIPRAFKNKLLEACVEPDRAPDYVPRHEVVLEAILTEDASKPTRVPHHTASTRFIMGLLQRARGELLRRGRATRSVAATLGRALHYVQDRCIVSPKISRRYHDEVERRVSAYLRRVQVKLVEPLGETKLRSLLRRQRASREAARAVSEALALTYAVLYAVICNPLKAPSDLLVRAQEFRGRLRGVLKAVYTAVAATPLLSTLFVAVTALPTIVAGLQSLKTPEMLTHFTIAIIPLSFSSVVGIFTLEALFSRRLTVFLRRLHDATDGRYLVIVALFTFLALNLPRSIFAAAVCVSALACTMLTAAPYLSRNFRLVRGEAYWFKWD